MTFKIGSKVPEVHTQPTRPAAPPPPPPRPATPPPSSNSHFDSARATLQRQSALHASGTDILSAPLSEASTLRTEVLGDGRANCLEKAVRLAGPHDSIVLLHDAKDGVGHALLRREDGSFTDPNYPTVRYETLGQWQALHPQYTQPVTVNARDVRTALSVPPGPQRDATLAKLGLLDEASVRVADSGTPPPTPEVRNARSDGVVVGADGKITYTQQTTIEPREFEFERGQFTATAQGGPYFNSEVELEWDPNSPNTDGTYPVTVTYTDQAGAQGGGSLAYGPYGASMGRAAGITQEQQYTLNLTPAQMLSLSQGALPLASIADPLSLPVGGSMSIDNGSFRNTTGSITYGPLTLSSEALQTNTYSTAVERTGDSTVRVTVGPRDRLESNLELGLSFGEHASLTMTRERIYTDENLVSVQFDLATPQGQAAYETFLRDGALPTAEGPGVSGLFHEQTYSYEGALAAGIELGPLSAGGELWSEDSVITRHTQDGVETLTTQDTLANGVTVSGAFTPSPDGNHRFEALSFTLPNPSGGTPVTMNIRGEEGFMALRQLAAQQMQQGVVDKLSSELNLSQADTLAWMQTQGEPYATMARPTTDPNFSVEGFAAAFDQSALEGWAPPEMPLLTESLLLWQPGDPYLPVFTNNLQGTPSLDALVGEPDLDRAAALMMFPPSLFDLGLQNLPGVEITGN